MKKWVIAMLVVVFAFGSTSAFATTESKEAKAAAKVVKKAEIVAKKEVEKAAKIAAKEVKKAEIATKKAEAKQVKLAAKELKKQK